LSQAFLPGASLEPAVIPTAQASSFTLHTFRIMCDVPSIAVFCSESVECFPGIVSKFFFKLLVIIPVAPIIIIIQYVCLLSQAFLPGTSLEPAVIPTAQASSYYYYYYYYYCRCRHSARCVKAANLVCRYVGEVIKVSTHNKNFLLTQIAHKLHTIYFCIRIFLKPENILVGC